MDPAAPSALSFSTLVESEEEEEEASSAEEVLELSLPEAAGATAELLSGVAGEETAGDEAAGDEAAGDEAAPLANLPTPHGIFSPNNNNSYYYNNL